MKRIIDSELHLGTNITGKNIRRLRKLRGFSQAQLSAKLETLAVYVCRGSISRIENGSRFVTDIELQAFAEVLDVSIEDFFREEELP